MIEESCPTCGGSGRVPVAAGGLEAPVAELRAWLKARGHRIEPGDEVCTRAATDALGVSAQWLRTAACYDLAAPSSRKVGRRRLYPLRELACGRWRTNPMASRAARCMPVARQRLLVAQ